MDMEGWLKELRVPREAYRVVSLLPLVYVAWADGKIQKSERDLILHIARERGMLDHGEDPREAVVREVLAAGTRATRPDLITFQETLVTPGYDQAAEDGAQDGRRDREAAAAADDRLQHAGRRAGQAQRGAAVPEQRAAGLRAALLRRYRLHPRGSAFGAF